jgi:hypothetical protein
LIFRDCCKSICRFEVSVAEPIGGGKQAVTVPALLRHSPQTHTRMPIKTSQPLSLHKLLREKRKTKRVFLKQIAQLIHWEPVASVLEKYYPTGQAAQGRKAYPALVLFKMTLLQTWYNLSD